MVASQVIKLSHPETRQFWEIPVLFEDEYLLAIDKPAGLALTPVPDAPEVPNLLTLLHEAIARGKPWAAERGITFLKHSHPLDAEISGVLLLAKKKEIQSALAELFGTEKPRQMFLALVQGNPLQPRFEIDAPIAPDPVRAGLMRVDSQRGKKARTECDVVEVFDRHALVRCRILGFRGHQARVHLRHARHTVVGDRPYAGKLLMLSTLKRSYRLKPDHEERPLVSTPAIFSEELVLPHPVTGAELSISAGMPKHLAVALKYLRRYQHQQAGAMPDPADAAPQADGAH